MGKIASYTSYLRRTLAPGGHRPGYASYCHLAGTETESSKGHYVTLSSKLLQDGGEYGKASEFYKLTTVLYLL